MMPQLILYFMGTMPNPRFRQRWDWKWRNRQVRISFVSMLHYKDHRSVFHTDQSTMNYHNKDQWCCPSFDVSLNKVLMMTSSNGNIFRVTGPLCGEFIGHWWIPLTKPNYAELWYFLWSESEQTVEQTIETLVIWDAIALIMKSL